MKNLKYILIILFVISQILAGCKSETTGPTSTQQDVNKITYNGAGHVNVSVQPYFTLAAYISGMNLTGIRFDGIISPGYLDVVCLHSRYNKRYFPVDIIS